MTAGVFLPAFAFTLIGHHHLERLIDNVATHAFLDGVTAGVVGLIAVTSLRLLPETIVSLPAALIFVTALAALYRWKAGWVVAVVVAGAGALGGVLFR